MSKILNTIAGVLGTAVLAGGVAMAVPQSRNAIMDSIAKNSTIYQTAMEKNSELEQDNKDLQETSSAQADAIAKLRTDLDTKSTALTKCQGDLETVTGKKTELETALASKEIEIQNLTQDKTELTTQLETANSEKIELQTTVTNLTSSVQTLTDQKSTLETELETAETDKQALQTQLDLVNAQLTTTQSDLATAQSSLATKTSEIETLTSQLTSKQAELDQANSDKANLQSQLDSAHAQIAELQTQVSTLETEKADLQKQVDDLTASAEVVVTTKPVIDYTIHSSSGSTTGSGFYNKVTSHGHDAVTFKNFFDKVNYPTLEFRLGYTYFCSGPDFSFDADTSYCSDYAMKAVNNLNMKFYVGTPDNNTFLGENLDFLNCVADGSYIYWNCFNCEYELSADGSEFNYFTINFYLNQLDLDNSKATNTYKSSISDNTISIFSGINCLTFGDPTAYNYIISDGIMTVYYISDNSIYTTIDMSADSQQFTWNGETYILQEPDVTVDNITAHIAGTVDGVQTTIHIGDGNNYIKFGDGDAISIEIMTIDELKTSGYMSIMRTDTSETIYLSNITLNYNASSGIYVISSATYNGVILAC